MQTFTTKSGIVYTLPQQHIARGGEGSVFDVLHHPDLVAKIYHKHYLSPTLHRKLATMVANPPQDDTRHALNHVSIAWPEQLLYEHGQFIGYVMKKIPQSDAIYALLHAQTRNRKYPRADHRMIYRVARNLAAAMAALHKKNYIIGDVNYNNALFNARALVTVVDCDSMQVVDTHGQTHFCRVGMAEYTAPELQGKDLSTTIRTKDSDTFGLAVLIYQLIMQGFHPFNGKPLPGAPDVDMVHVYCITQRIFPYETNPQFVPPPAAPPFDALPDELQVMFKRAFLSTSRPSAHEWQKVLATCEQKLQPCASNARHYHPSDGSCVICAVTSKTRQLRLNIRTHIWLHTAWTWIKIRGLTSCVWIIGIIILVGLYEPLTSLFTFIIDVWRVIFGE